MIIPTLIRCFLTVRTRRRKTLKSVKMMSKVSIMTQPPTPRPKMKTTTMMTKTS